MNIKGSGVTYFKESHSDEMRLFQGGLRNIPHGQLSLEHGRYSPREHEDFLSYNRGSVIHSRSPHTQHLNYHFMFGGPRKFIFERLLYQNVYKRMIRPAWIPAGLLFMFQCWGQRMYDNAAYDYFYFSD